LGWILDEFDWLLSHACAAVLSIHVTKDRTFACRTRQLSGGQFPRLYFAHRNSGLLRKKGCVALFVGKRAVEKAAAWKSPTAGLSHSAWKSRNRGGISHFSHRPDHEEFRFLIL
ncbi:MAG TPA: hypothetical protein VEJ17_00515, partial [Candidatus Nitrosotalea sp.]|nr:hypothetical protein [Candidatus Nitrosotalea sp.]